MRNRWFIYTVTTLAVGVAMVCIFSVASGSLGYFTTVSFVVALPVVAGFLANFASRLQPLHRSAMVYLICLTVFLTPARHLFWYKYLLSAEGSNPFVEQLLSLRHRVPQDTILAYDLAQPIEQNVHEHELAAKSLLLPAVTERAWLGAISPKMGCYDHVFRSYNFYRTEPASPELGCFRTQHVPDHLRIESAAGFMRGNSE